MALRGTLAYTVFCLVLAAACSCGCLQLQADNFQISASGTITYVDLEGGFYGILAEDGTQYRPLNLPPDLQVEGLNITFTGVVRQDAATLQQWGVPLEIQSISGDGVHWIQENGTEV